MDYALILSIASFLIIFLLSSVTWFLNRLITQNDKTHEANKQQFKELIDEVKEVKTSLSLHQSDVALGFQETKGTVSVLLEKIQTHSELLCDLNILYDRVRLTESEILVIKERIAKR